MNEQLAKTKNDTRNTSSTGTSSSTGQNASTSNSSSNGLTINSDTPQGNISKTNILAGNYASSTQGNESQTAIQDTTATNTSGSVTNQEAVTNAGTESYSKNKSGYNLKMTKADLLANYRKNIFNINEAIIDDLNSLFFALY